MHLHSSRRSIVALMSEIVTVSFLLIQMMIAAAVTAGLVILAGRLVSWPRYAAIIAAPLLYVVWLCLFLLISGFVVGVIGRRNPKPRFRVGGDEPNMSDVLKDDLGVLTAIICYVRMVVVRSLPLVPAFGAANVLGRLVLRSYAPSISVGRDLMNWGSIYDPDLTEIGDQVIIGGGAVLASHSLLMRPDGRFAYLSAPIRIGNRVTIGGESRVALGCVIEDDAVVEPGAVVPAMTRIPAGEVWGGNPARFRRRRDDTDATLDDQPVATIRIRPNGVPPAESDDLRRLVLSALDLDGSAAPAELSSDTCPTWDSLGQLAIAAAIFDRYEVVVAEDDVYRLRTLLDVSDAIHGRLMPDTTSPEDGHVGPDNAADDALSLPDDLELLPLLDHQQATRALAARAVHVAADAQRVSVVVAATFTAQPLASSLRLWAGAYGLGVECRFADYDQIIQTLLDERGAFATNRSAVNLILARPEDLWAGAESDTAVRIDQVVAALRGFVEAGPLPGELLVGTLPPAVSAVAPMARGEADWLRERWRAQVGEVAGVTLFDFSGVVERVGSERARDSAGEVHSRSPYSALLYQELGIALARHIRARRRSPAKVVAIDCDNTLWGGVVGEVGFDGIELGEDGPGRAFQLFQQRLKSLKERGLLLSVVSRNEEADVLEVFERHPGMILRPEDIATWRVNWNHKSENLRSLADEMNLGLDSFVFLDDDPAVRAEVAARVPEVHVVPLLDSPADYAGLLERLWLFDGAQATAVDAARTQMMQEEGRRQRESKSAASLEEFLTELELRVEMRPPDDAEWARVAQLTQRTNQFNLSLKRRTVEEVRVLASEAAILVLKAADRFGDYGLVGVVFVRPPNESGAAEIDTLLMSCRALGRGVEDAFLAGMAALAVGEGASTLVAPYVEGKRNAMVLDYLRRSGFSEVDPGRWALPLADPPLLPAHVAFVGPELVVTGVAE